MALSLLGAVKVLLAVQAVQATVAGTVRDAESGRPIESALVALTDLDRAVSTGADGRYVLLQVPPGPHHITVRFIGYSQRTLHALVPRDGQLEINVSLRPEPVRLPTIEVRPPVAVRGTDNGDSTAFPDRGSSMAAVWNHPLLAEPDAFQALGGGEVVLNPESPSGVHIRGGASDQTGYLLDGIPVFSPYHAAGVFSAWNPDALAGLHLSSSAPSPEHPDALAGVITGVTRAPGPILRAQGSLSTTQARLTLDGPLGVAGASFLVSLRSGAPYFLSKHEASYLKSEVGDWLVKLEAPALGGRIRLLGYDNDNEIDAASAVNAAPSAESGRNAFEWRSRSLGAEWRRVFPGLSLQILGWHAAADAGSVWAGQDGTIDLSATRRDQGLVAAVEHSSARGSTVAGLRLERSRTAYRLEADSAPGPAWELSARTPVVTVFAQHARALGHHLDLRVGAALASTRGDRYLGPRVQLRWTPSDRLTLVASSARTHQFAQSLRNSESVVGNVFPADLYIGAGAPGVPVARSDQQAVGAEYRPAAGVRLGLQAYQRAFEGVLLVAPRDGEPFTTGAYAVGSGRSRGLSLDAAVSTARLGIVASYGWQHVRLDPGTASYVPNHGATHLLEGGVTVFPTATTSIRLGAAGALGRRTTTVSGGFEWEACNLLDRGCEFGGSPHTGTDGLGGTPLPSYVRVDLGVRKHWHLTVGRRDAVVALFGTITNILKHKNLLTYAKDPTTGELSEIEMRPLAPLVVGLDWRF